MKFEVKSDARGRELRRRSSFAEQRTLLLAGVMFCAGAPSPVEACPENGLEFEVITLRRVGPVLNADGEDAGAQIDAQWGQTVEVSIDPDSEALLLEAVFRNEDACADCC